MSDKNIQPIIKNIWFLILFINIGCFSCKKGEPIPIPTWTVDQVSISTDKACYKPNEQVTFNIDNHLPATTKIRYKYLNETIYETSLNGLTWNWKVPSDDFKGYMIDLYDIINGAEKIYGSIAVDVSSSWSHFPRYGFLSKYPKLADSEMEIVMNNLNRYHINGIQFYDWEYKHHLPLAGTNTNPFSIWKDIMNRDTYLSTVKQYINLSHQHGMMAMFYNLGFGALNDAYYDGVSEQWFLYTDKNHVNRDQFNLPCPPFKSNIYLLDPSNIGWQNYIGAKNNDVYSVFNFDGFHIDQLGDRGKALFTYTGNTINLDEAYPSLIESMKRTASDKKLVMNAVNQYGQQGIVSKPVEFLYTEVWSPNEGYKNLADIITANDALSNNSKKTVLAAYMNYDLANNPGYFNTPGVLLTDAVIFAFGGSHLELGEHMLSKEYFPNENLQMNNDLKTSLSKYYDFLVAYENLLRDGGIFNNPTITSSGNQLQLANWPPQSGKVAVIGKDFSSKQVLHLINFANAISFDWRDKNGTQTIPKTIQNCTLYFSTNKTVSKVWYASPDVNFGTSSKLAFTQSGNQVSFILPSLQYWDMIVIEYQ
ncbi:MAG: cycloisomaltooligosaccharide glucanotransferase [Bacteroidetes bacterium]|nr:cycloisomaltooligosaccharide glucanotransferase [Bacteroidota bacterium]